MAHAHTLRFHVPNSSVQERLVRSYLGAYSRGGSPGAKISVEIIRLVGILAFVALYRF